MIPPAAPPPERLTLDRLASPVGVVQLAVDETGALRMLEFDADSPRARKLMARHFAGVPTTAGTAPAAIRRALEAYFAGQLTALAAIPVRLGGTDFQRRVWTALTDIPPGVTESYGALAARIGQPRAVRAVGLANGANPVGIVIPCRRVIGADGALTGYGGGLERKRWLLAHEGALAA